MGKETKLHAVNVDNIAPVTVGNPVNVADLSIDQSHLEEYTSLSSESSVVECRRPPKGIFFTVKKETGRPFKDRKFYFLLQIEGRDPYLVAPAVAEQKREEDVIRPVLICRYVTMAGEEGLWALKLDAAEKSNAWNKSALSILEMAENGWVRIMSTKKHFRHQVSKKSLEEVRPQFTERTFDSLVSTAFQDRVITSTDHEIWEILEHGSDK